MLNDKKLRLGKGLGALIPDLEDEEIASDSSLLKEIQISNIIPNPFQPRRHFDEQAINDLAASIKEHGLNQPVIVRPIDEKYELVAGERRLRACKKLQMETITCLIKDLTDDQSLQIALIENLQREDINPVEEARAFHMLLKKFNYTQEQLSEKIGKSRPFISNSIRLLDLPDAILKDLMLGEISTGHARSLLSLPVNDQKMELLALIKEKSLSVRQTEQAVKSMLEGNKLIKSKDIKYHFEYEDTIKKSFWKKFSFKGDNKKGQLIFKYSSPEEKEELLKKFGI